MADGHAGSMVATMSSEEIIVASPFDGTEIGRVPLSHRRRRRSRRGDGEAGVARRRPAALEARRDPRHRRPPAREREEEFARTIAAEAAKPIRTARAEAQRAVGTFQFAAAEARTFAGEIVPLDAIPAGEGKVGFAMRVPIGVVGAISPFNFPLNLVAHKLAPAIAAGCPVVLKPASQTPLSAVALGCAARRRVRPAGRVPARRHGRREHGGQRHRRTPRHRDDHVHRVARRRLGHPRQRTTQAGRTGARQQRPGDHRAPTATGRRRRARSASAGFSHAGQSCISTQRVLVHHDIAEAFTATLVDEVSTLVVGDPLDEATEVSALISTVRT